MLPSKKNIIPGFVTVLICYFAVKFSVKLLYVLSGNRDVAANSGLTNPIKYYKIWFRDCISLACICVQHLRTSAVVDSPDSSILRGRMKNGPDLH